MERGLRQHLGDLSDVARAARRLLHLDDAARRRSTPRPCSSARWRHQRHLRGRERVLRDGGGRGTRSGCRSRADAGPNRGRRAAPRGRGARGARCLASGGRRGRRRGRRVPGTPRGVVERHESPARGGAAAAARSRRRASAAATGSSSSGMGPTSSCGGSGEVGRRLELAGSRRRRVACDIGVQLRRRRPPRTTTTPTEQRRRPTAAAAAPAFQRCDPFRRVEGPEHVVERDEVARASRRHRRADDRPAGAPAPLPLAVLRVQAVEELVRRSDEDAIVEREDGAGRAAELLLPDRRRRR